MGDREDRLLHRGQRDRRSLGLGLAFAILLDALVVRTIPVPAIMQLFGRANWYLPKVIDRVLPHLSVEAAGTVTTPTRHDLFERSGPVGHDRATSRRTLAGGPPVTDSVARLSTGPELSTGCTRRRGEAVVGCFYLIAAAGLTTIGAF